MVNECRNKLNGHTFQYVLAVCVFHQTQINLTESYST